MMSRVQTLNTKSTKKTWSEWLAWRDHSVSQDIRPGLRRLQSAWQAILKPQNQQAFDLGKVISVAGTNGKGTAVHYLQRVYSQAGYDVAAYFSPELCHYRERVRPCDPEIYDPEIHDSENLHSKVHFQDHSQNHSQSGNSAQAADVKPSVFNPAMHWASESEWVAAFELVAPHVNQYDLTLFEFDTLAAFCVIAAQTPDISVLEVGMGGRLDAVNIIDADIAMVTTIGLDHVDFLGNTRELIAIEKMGIGRAGKPLFCADESPPCSIVTAAKKQDVLLYQVGQHFQAAKYDIHASLAPSAAGAINAIVDYWQDVFFVENAVLISALQAPGMPGRLQYLSSTMMQAQNIEQTGGKDYDLLLDVAHNEESAQRLVAFLQNCLQSPNASYEKLDESSVDNDISSYKIHWVLGMLADKPAAEVWSTLAGIEQFNCSNAINIDSQWYLAGLDYEPRGLSAADLKEKIIANTSRQLDGRLDGQLDTSETLTAVEKAACYADPMLAYAAAVAECQLAQQKQAVQQEKNAHADLISTSSTEKPIVKHIIVVTGSFRTVAAVWCPSL